MGVGVCGCAHACVCVQQRCASRVVEDVKLKTWRFHLLTTAFNFMIADTTEDLFWKNNSIREDMRSRSPTQPTYC